MSLVSAEDKYDKIRKIVQKELSSSAHDMDHVMRVYALCLRLAKDESHVDLDVLKTAALLHDIARAREDQEHSKNIDHAVLAAEISAKILRDLGYSWEEIGKVQHCILTHRFRSEFSPETKEAKILFDADKLDVLGAIGIGRSFIIAGEQGEKIYSETPIDDYIGDNLVGGKSDGRIKDPSKHAPNLEYETKFKHVPEKLYTQRAREIAKERLGFMSGFFERLRKEIRGDI